MCRYRYTHYYSPIKRGCMMTIKDIIRWKSKLKKVLPAFICIFLCRSKDTEEKAMAPHSSTLAWKIPRTEERGRLQSMGLLRVGHDWATSLSLSCIGEGNGNPLQCSCLENPKDGEPGRLLSMGLHRVGHDWSDLAAAAKTQKMD